MQPFYILVKIFSFLFYCEINFDSLLIFLAFEFGQKNIFAVYFNFATFFRRVNKITFLVWKTVTAQPPADMVRMAMA